MPRVFNQASRIRFVSVLRTAVSGNMTRHDNGLRPNTVPTSLGTLQTLDRWSGHSEVDQKF